MVVMMLKRLRKLNKKITLDYRTFCLSLILVIGLPTFFYTIVISNTLLTYNDGGFLVPSLFVTVVIMFCIISEKKEKKD